MKEIFEDIIKNWKWKKHPCGPGSTLIYTENLRQQLPLILKKYDITSMIDIPCGDFSWMNGVLFPKNFKYIGADIVDFLIEDNREKYSGKEFQVIDITKDNIPDVDLLFCRDCLLHLSNENIIKTFQNIKRSNIKYIMMSNWFDEFDNFKDIPNGKHRYLNFLEPPYMFNSPIDEIVDFIDGFPKRKMLLWEKNVINKFLEEF